MINKKKLLKYDQPLEGTPTIPKKQDECPVYILL